MDNQMKNFIALLKANGVVIPDGDLVTLNWQSQVNGVLSSAAELRVNCADSSAYVSVRDFAGDEPADVVWGEYDGAWVMQEVRGVKVTETALAYEFALQVKMMELVTEE